MPESQPNNPGQSPRKSEELRKEFEEATYLNQPSETWSDADKQAFRKLYWKYTNWVSNTIPTIFYTEGENSESLDTPCVVEYDENDGPRRFSDEQVAQYVQEGYMSLQYYNGTMRTVANDIKAALIANGVDLEALKKKVDRKMELYEIKMENGHQLPENLAQENEENNASILAMTLPSMMDLIDSGYIFRELNK